MHETPEQEKARDERNRATAQNDEQERLKRRISIDEAALIQKLITAGLDVAEIAKKLKRPEKSIREFLSRKRDEVKENTKEDLIATLRRKHYWPQVKSSLKDVTEIEYFEREWASIYSQLLSQDVLHTDEIMVRDLVLQDINCFRITSATAEVHKRKEQLEKMIYDELARDPDVQNTTQVAVWRNEIAAYVSSLTALSKQYNECQSYKDSLFKSLKTTRDQRFKELKEVNKDIFSLVMTLDTLENREKEGRYTTLIHMASKKIEEDWSKAQMFADGFEDRLLLSAETLEKEDEENKEDKNSKEKDDG